MGHPWWEVWERARAHHEELLREAERQRRLARLRRPWRVRLAYAFLLLADRLAPGLAEGRFGEGRYGREKARPGNA